MQKSLDRDLEKIIERLKKCVNNFTSDTQLDQVRLNKVIYTLGSII